ncbi:MAG: hypothetical protein ACE5I7_19660, partial [Candidatus Binatia bacterium]
MAKPAYRITAGTRQGVLPALRAMGGGGVPDCCRRRLASMSPSVPCGLAGRLLWGLCLLSVALAMPAPRLAAAASIVAWENDQIRPAVAYNGSANEYLVVWEDHHWGFGTDWDIYGQRVNAGGTTAGG